MSQQDNQNRYDDILSRIKNRKPFGKQPETPAKTSYDLILDTLNVYDTLAALPIQKYPNILCYGPKVIRQSTWSGVVVWYFNKGYHGYRTLNIFGVWVQQNDVDIEMKIGLRELPYQATVYNPEGFHASIRKDFQLFYNDKGHPPYDTDEILFKAVYQQKERLTFRQTLQSHIHHWKLKMESD